MEELPPGDPRRNVRRTDPETSHRAARGNRRGRVAQKWRMLLAHGEQFQSSPDNYAGLNADEAWQLADGEWPTGKCYWKRHGELMDEGFLKPLLDRSGNVVERSGMSGYERDVLYLTPEGWDRYLSISSSSGGSNSGLGNG